MREIWYFLQQFRYFLLNQTYGASYCDEKDKAKSQLIFSDIIIQAYRISITFCIVALLKLLHEHLIILDS